MKNRPQVLGRFNLPRGSYFKTLIRQLLRLDVHFFVPLWITKRIKKVNCHLYYLEISVSTPNIFRVSLPHN